MKERFNLYLTGTCSTPGATYQDFTFTIDLKQLLPLHLRDKHFRLYTSFHTSTNWGATVFSALRISAVFLKNHYNKAYTPSDYTPLGVATPLAVSTTTGTSNFGYFLFEKDSYVPIINFPDSTNTFTLRVQGAQNLTTGSWVANLSFEPI